MWFKKVMKSADIYGETDEGVNAPAPVTVIPNNYTRVGWRRRRVRRVTYGSTGYGYRALGRPVHGGGVQDLV